MNSNTVQRVVSGILLMLFLALNLYAGRLLSTISIGVMGLFLIWEIHSKFLQLPWKTPSFYLSILLYSGIYLLGLIPMSYGPLLTIALAINIFLLTYLCSSSISFISLKKVLSFEFSKSIFPALYFGSTLSVFSWLISQENWLYLILLLFSVASVTDIFAWVFGKNFGRHKLWPAISPKKTIEGLVGGVVSSSFCTYYLWKTYLNENLSPAFILVFALLSFLSQTGDLVQSKIKREFGIKDSSDLIPGHGGVYDRFDSYLFILPFFALISEFMTR